MLRQEESTLACPGLPHTRAMDSSVRRTPSKGCATPVACSVQTDQWRLRPKAVSPSAARFRRSRARYDASRQPRVHISLPDVRLQRLLVDLLCGQSRTVLPCYGLRLLPSRKLHYAGEGACGPSQYRHPSHLVSFIQVEAGFHFARPAHLYPHTHRDLYRRSPGRGDPMPEEVAGQSAGCGAARGLLVVADRRAEVARPHPGHRTVSGLPDLVGGEGADRVHSRLAAECGEPGEIRP